MTDDALSTRKRIALLEIDRVISNMEALQSRPVRALLLNPQDEQARDRLQSLESDIAALRSHRNKVAMTSTLAEFNALVP